MQRAFIPLILIITLFPLHSQVDEQHFREFRSSAATHDYAMRQGLKHPAQSAGLDRFYPALSGRSLYIVSPGTGASQLSLKIDQDWIDIKLPSSGQNIFSMEIIIPEDLYVTAILLEAEDSYSLISSRNTPLKLDLNDPDTFLLSYPEEEGSEILLSLNISGEVNANHPEKGFYRIQPSEGLRTFSLPHQEEGQWSLSPSAHIEALSYEIVPTESFPYPLNREGSQILSISPDVWRNPDYEIYRWSSFPEILIFDCLDYSIQQRFFRRLAYFVEKKGYKGRILSNAELEGKHGWNAHDYRPSDLADFFNRVEELGIQVYEEELFLKDLLLEEGILSRNAKGYYQAGQGAVLSISQESSPVLRHRFFVHEATHGVYFVSEEYREMVSRLWFSLDEEDRSMWRLFLGWYGYDPEDEDLMINEFQAYLLQQDISQASEYFSPRMANLAHTYPGHRDIFLRGVGADSSGFQLWAEVLETWIWKKWGIKAGNFSSLHKELP